MNVRLWCHPLNIKGQRFLSSHTFALIFDCQRGEKKSTTQATENHTFVISLKLKMRCNTVTFDNESGEQSGEYFQCLTEYLQISLLGERRMPKNISTMSLMIQQGTCCEV